MFHISLKGLIKNVNVDSHPRHRVPDIAVLPLVVVSMLSDSRMKGLCVHDSRGRSDPYRAIPSDSNFSGSKAPKVQSKPEEPRCERLRI